MKYLIRFRWQKSLRRPELVEVDRTEHIFNWIKLFLIRQLHPKWALCISCMSFLFPFPHAPKCISFLYSPYTQLHHHATTTTHNQKSCLPFLKPVSTLCKLCLISYWHERNKKTLTFLQTLEPLGSNENLSARPCGRHGFHSVLCDPLGAFQERSCVPTWHGRLA